MQITRFELAPAVGFEPTTNRLTADRSTTELRWIVSAKKIGEIYLAHSLSAGKRQSVNPDYSRDSTTELRWITQLKNRECIFSRSHSREATANRLIPNVSGLYH